MLAFGWSWSGSRDPFFKCWDHSHVFRMDEAKHPREILHVLNGICSHTSQKTCVSCKFNSRVKAEGLLKVTSIHVHCKSGNISETVQDTYIVTTDPQKPNSTPLSGRREVRTWSQTGPKLAADRFEAGSKLVADLQRAEIWPII